MNDEQKPGWWVMLEIGCKAPKEFFEPFAWNIPKEYQEMLKLHGPIPCEGSGDVGLLCVSPNCYWVEWDGEWEVEPND